MDKFVIDRKKTKSAFAEYTSNYDTSDSKIRLKVEHTYRVAALCERIAESLELSAYDTSLAWLTGMLHDVGRFEQIRQFGTFSDADSVDHAHYAVNILFDNGEINNYLDDPGKLGNDLEVVKKAIWNHSAYRIEEGLDERTFLFCNIIRDADKLDIFKVISDTPLEDVYNFNTEDIFNTEVSDEVMQAIREKHAVLRSLKKTPVDYIAGHIALVFELVFPASLAIAKEQGYLEKLMYFNTNNKKTMCQFQEIREIIGNYSPD